MRKLKINIRQIGLNLNDEINIQLLNRVGELAFVSYKNSFVSFNETYIVNNDILEIDLYENDLIKEDTYYQIKIKSNIFTFRVKSSETNLSCEFSSLVKLGGLDSLGFIENEELIFEDDFIKRLEVEFLNKEEENFTANQERVFELYVYYADFVLDKDSATIDICRKLDNYLGGL